MQIINEDQFFEIMFDEDKEIVEKTSTVSGYCITAIHNTVTNVILAVREMSVYGTEYYIPEENEQ